MDTANLAIERQISTLYAARRRIGRVEKQIKGALWRLLIVGRAPYSRHAEFADETPEGIAPDRRHRRSPCGHRDASRSRRRGHRPDVAVITSCGRHSRPLEPHQGAPSSASVPGRASISSANRATTTPSAAAVLERLYPRAEWPYSDRRRHRCHAERRRRG